MTSDNEMTNQAAQTMHPDALPDGTLSKSTVKRVTALAAASVSERAALLAIIAEGIRNAERHPRQQYGLNLSTLRAIEQALTQQRGECVPEGWRLVPIEPNWDMRNEGREFLIDGLHKEPEKLAYFLWKTMVAAAPEVE